MEADEFAGIVSLKFLEGGKVFEVKEVGEFWLNDEFGLRFSDFFEFWLEFPPKFVLNAIVVFATGLGEFFEFWVQFDSGIWEEG